MASGNGGALINLGSVESDYAIPLQGMYSASKHAVKGFTDALRIELQDAGAPVSVTLIKPWAIGTPLREHVKNYFEDEATLPPPVYGGSRARHLCTLPPIAGATSSWGARACSPAPSTNRCRASPTG